MEPGEVTHVIEAAFGGNEYPGDAWIQGSHEGDEPFEEVGAFRGQSDWRQFSSSFLDTHYTALSFFSEAGFRFFLPAYLVADVRDELKTADPLFHVVHGFSEGSVTHTLDGRTFVLRLGRHQFINPRRFGACTFFDYARHRLSVFSREEAAAIVAYLEWSRTRPSRATDHEGIDRALSDFWHERAASAPTSSDLRRYIIEQAAYVEALMRDRGGAR